MQRLVSLAALFLIPLSASAQDSKNYGLLARRPGAFKVAPVAETARLFERPDSLSSPNGVLERGPEATAYERAGLYFAVACPGLGHVGFALAREVQHVQAPVAPVVAEFLDEQGRPLSGVVRHVTESSAYTEAVRPFAGQTRRIHVATVRPLLNRPFDGASVVDSLRPNVGVTAYREANGYVAVAAYETGPLGWLLTTDAVHGEPVVPALPGAVTTSQNPFVGDDYDLTRSIPAAPSTTLTPPMQTLSAASYEELQPSTATLLNVLVAGLGHFYANDANRGATILAFSAGAPIIGYAITASTIEASCDTGYYGYEVSCRDETNYVPLAIGVAGGLAAWIYGIVDAPKAVERENARRAGLAARLVPLTNGVALRVTLP